MGCVYSHDEQRSKRRHRQHQYAVQQAQPQIPRPKVVKRPQQQPQQSRRPSNGQAPPSQYAKPRATTPSPTHDSGVDVTSPSHEAAASNSDNFRRQHFDRNSVLRHSKKRSRKASVNGSATNTPVKSPTVAAVASCATGADIPDPIEAETNNASSASPINVDDEHIKTKKEIQESSDVTTTSTTTTTTTTTTPTFSASANVAALLGKPSQQQQETETQSPTLEAIQEPNSRQQQQPPRSLSYSSQAAVKEMAKGHITNKKASSVAVVKKARSSSVSTPASAASVNKHLDNKSRKTSHQPSLQTPTPNVASSSSSGQNGRRALRTRREAAREASEAVNGTQDIEPEEDCGRLI